MVRVGDSIIATKKSVYWEGWEMIVVDTEVSTYIKQYLPKAEIRAKDSYGNFYLLEKDEYRLKTYEDEEFLKVYPKQRDKNTQKPFYYVIDKSKSHVFFFDDKGTKRSFSKDEVKVFTEKDIIDGLYQVSSELNELKQVFAETFEKLSDDFNNTLNKLE